MSSLTTQVLGSTTGGRLSMVEWALMALALFAIHVLLQENGALFSGEFVEYLHEFAHDARHGLGVPCH